MPRVLRQETIVLLQPYALVLNPKMVSHESVFLGRECHDADRISKLSLELVVILSVSG